MKSPCPASRTYSSVADGTLGRPFAEVCTKETGDIASAPSSPCPDEGWENLMDWDVTERASVYSGTCALSPASAKRGLSAPVSSFNTIANPGAETNEKSGLLTDSRKRKSPSAHDGNTDATTSVSQSEIAVSKRSHNAIEKRYRTNLNHKIAALRDAVPSLRKLHDPVADDIDGLPSAPKLNKATVLSKAIEYIQHLESRNQRLEEENAVLKECVSAMEEEGTNIARTSFEAAPEVSGNAANIGSASVSTVTEHSPPAFNDPQGMIRVPEDIRRLRQGAPQAHYHERSPRPLPSPGSIEVYLGAMLRMP